MLTNCPQNKNAYDRDVPRCNELQFLFDTADLTISF